MFRTIVYAALLAGVAAGLFAWALQAVRVVPIILEAETFEVAAERAGARQDGHDDGAAHSGHDHVAAAAEAGAAWAPEGGLERTVFTILANVLVGVGFGLLLAAAFALRGGADWYLGLMWGLGGFVTFTLAPAIGLPPEIPGAVAADLFARQVWWLGTALATGTGFALLFLVRRLGAAALGAALIALPHLIGAPAPGEHGGFAPDELARDFVVATLVTDFLFWLLLGGLTGFFFGKLMTVDVRVPAWREDKAHG